MTPPQDRPPEASLLARSWVHAREEDGPEQLVAYRAEGSQLPPARGRTLMRLVADGGYERRAPGPDDRLVATSGRWTLHGSRLVLEPQDGQPVRFEVVLVTDDRLLLRPQPESPGRPPGPRPTEQP